VVLAHAIGLRDLEGRVTRYVAVLVDVTAQRALDAQRAISGRLTALETLVGGLSHEANNPLAAVVSSLGWVGEELTELRDELRAGAPFEPQVASQRLEALLDALGDATEASARLTRLVKNLSLFGRPDPVQAPVQLSAVVKQALRYVPDAVLAAGRLYVADLGAPEVLGSEGQLAQVVVSLVTNALQALTPDARGEVRVTCSRAPGGEARLEVRDNGAGIRPEVLARMFDPFFTTREVGQGAGLGLAVARSIVKAHAGTLTASSEVGAGSVFTVELPALASAVLH
jgi:signal transduction histidine kinase